MKYYHESSDPSQVLSIFPVKTFITEGSSSALWIQFRCLFSLLQSRSFSVFPSLHDHGAFEEYRSANDSETVPQSVFMMFPGYQISIVYFDSDSTEVCSFLHPVRWRPGRVRPIAGHVHSDQLNKVLSARLCGCTVLLFLFLINDHFVGICFETTDTLFLIKLSIYSFISGWVNGFLFCSVVYNLLL